MQHSILATHGLCGGYWVLWSHFSRATCRLVSSTQIFPGPCSSLPASFDTVGSNEQSSCKQGPMAGCWSSKVMPIVALARSRLRLHLTLVSRLEEYEIVSSLADRDFARKSSSATLADDTRCQKPSEPATAPRSEACLGYSSQNNMPHTWNFLTRCEALSRK